MGTRERIVGCLSGLAVCDALGTTLEFMRPGTFEPLDDMVGGGPFGLEGITRRGILFPQVSHNAGDVKSEGSGVGPSGGADVLDHFHAS